LGGGRGTSGEGDPFTRRLSSAASEGKRGVPTRTRPVGESQEKAAILGMQNLLALGQVIPPDRKKGWNFPYYS